ncbi:membrane protein [Mycolicibacterium canariasense]|uniref:Membrane protein n=1 Tax=Mycolicibacterium canariasense TaxID=228230 RepID=A0A100WA29_MYCCR|nr:FAD/NAD(P)-binding protein [Mycolicibacterium canariasense]MCV7211922.1 FAD/NAD(P)-binding protein [Mycolicibacterium canariasense]ORU98014.1 pyridine nucleotide-disulfide oxidoreductase [Mycolicibacterium canariasense]GAS94243.1 membrane protein [Mycolicibacterium canariasense]
MHPTHYRWTIVGAGPSGIATVGRLIDCGIRPDEIAWVDPEFAVGDFGTRWSVVSSNTRVGGFLDFLGTPAAFGFHEAPDFAIRGLDPSQTCSLGAVAEPLQWITARLAERVATHKTTATRLELHQRRWAVHTEDAVLTSDNVVLAIGSRARSLDYPGMREIPLDVAVDAHKLGTERLDGATVAVFGSSHSTMLVLPNLLKQPVAEIINFYQHPLRYAVDFGDWTLFDDTGLKGHAAQWARDNLDGRLPERLHRCHVDDPRFDELLGRCDQVIYTVGFEPRRIEAPQWGPLRHNPANGIIAPGLFGIGIAFPGYRVDPTGFGEHRVGLEKFMEQLDKCLPIWLRYGA